MTVPPLVEPSLAVADVLAGGLLRREPAESSAALGAAVEVPEDLRESYAQARREPGGAARACRWLAVAAAYALVGAALWWAMDELYFGAARLRCEGELIDEMDRAIETFVGLLPMLARSVLLGAAFQLCRKVTSARGDGMGLGTALLTVGSDGDAETVRRAG